jgi:hypothetical protein
MKILLAILRKLFRFPDPKPVKRIFSRWTPI